MQFVKRAIKLARVVSAGRVIRTRRTVDARLTDLILVLSCCAPHALGLGVVKSCRMLYMYGGTGVHTEYRVRVYIYNCKHLEQKN